jgi:hypothetical protein
MHFDPMLFSFGYVLGLQGVCPSQEPSVVAGYQRAQTELSLRGEGRPTSGLSHAERGYHAIPPAPAESGDMTTKAARPWQNRAEQFQS